MVRAGQLEPSLKEVRAPSLDLDVSTAEAGPPSGVGVWRMGFQFSSKVEV